MYKRKITLFVSLVLLFAVSGANVFAKNPEQDLNLGNSKALRLSGNTEFFKEPVDIGSINAFNKANIERYSDYEVILVDSDTLAKIDAEKLVELIDNGSTLWVEDNNISLKEVSRILNLDEPDNRFVKGAQVTGAIIFNQNNDYCFGVTGIIGVFPVSSDDKVPQEDSEVFNYEPIPIYQSRDNFENSTISNVNDIKVDLENFISSVDKFRSDYNEQACRKKETDLVYIQLPMDKSFNGSPYYNYFTMSGGSMTITQYRYNIFSYTEGPGHNVKKTITDIVSNFTIAADPNHSSYVNYYNTRMHANVSNMDVIGQSYLNSNSSSSYTLSGGISIGANGRVTSGNVGASTTNSYSTNNQTITNDFYAQKCKNWNSDPTKNWVGASWEIEPCIRILNTNASSYQNQAYSSFEGGCLSGSGGGYTWTFYIPTVGVGGAWQ